MGLIGKIVYVGQIQSGVRQKDQKPWRVQECALQTLGQYPSTVAFSIFNDKIEQFAVNMDENVEIEYDIKSNFRNGRWFTTLSAYRVTRVAPPTAPMGPTVPLNATPVYQQTAPQGYAPSVQPSPFGAVPQQGSIPQQQDAYNTSTNSESLPF